MQNLKAKSLIIEKITSKHINEGWLTWVNDHQNVKVFNSPISKYNRKQLLKYIRNLKANKDLMFAVRIKESNEYIGNIKINNIDQLNKVCGYGR